MIAGKYDIPMMKTAVGCSRCAHQHHEMLPEHLDGVFGRCRGCGEFSVVVLRVFRRDPKNFVIANPVCV